MYEEKSVYRKIKELSIENGEKDKISYEQACEARPQGLQHLSKE